MSGQADGSRDQWLVFGKVGWDVVVIVIVVVVVVVAISDVLKSFAVVNEWGQIVCISSDVL